MLKKNATPIKWISKRAEYLIITLIWFHGLHPCVFWCAYTYLHAWLSDFESARVMMMMMMWVQNGIYTSSKLAYYWCLNGSALMPWDGDTLRTREIYRRKKLCWSLKINTARSGGLWLRMKQRLTSWSVEYRCCSVGTWIINFQFYRCRFN